MKNYWDIRRKLSKLLKQFNAQVSHPSQDKNFNPEKYSTNCINFPSNIQSDDNLNLMSKQ